jgi:hypothetical protein
MAGKNLNLQKTAYKIRPIFWTLFRTLMRDWTVAADPPLHGTVVLMDEAKSKIWLPKFHNLLCLSKFSHNIRS